MHNSHLSIVLGFALLLLTSASKAEPAKQTARYSLQSPDQQLALQLEVKPEGLFYSVNYAGRPVVMPSRLGLKIKGQAALGSGLKVVQTREREYNQDWQQPWGEQQTINEHYRELRVELAETGAKPRQLTLAIRAFNDGIGLRYEVPAQANLQEFVIEDELTEFVLAENSHTWWLPAYRNWGPEYQYLRSALSSVDVAFTPITLEARHYALAIHEAALVNYASMTLRLVNDNTKTLKVDLVPWPNGDKVRTAAPMQSPWRTIQVAPKAIDLLNSHLTLNLNEAPAPENLKADNSYIKPGKYMGIWWEMHIGEKDWSPGPKQGATTARAKEYIDFAAQHDISGILIEGWNKGWEGEWWQRKPTFIFDKPVDGLDLEEVTRYARDKGVEIIGHHETAAGVTYYEQQMDAAFGYYEKLGIHSVKMGYVGTRIDGDQWHHGQYMVNHFQRVVDTAARHKVMVNAHETVTDTGLRRTYPNLMTRECVRGMEYNGGSPDTGNMPDHTTIIPFTRGLSGPIDFTPGIFNFDYKKHRPYNRVPSTLANQLALYVVIYSPLQMVADLPENYAGHPAFQFIDDVPTDWKQSRALQGEIGEYLVIARQDKHSPDWYLGAITNQDARKLEVKLDFLAPKARYEAQIYRDGKDADWETNPEAYEIKRINVTAKSTLELDLKPGGGTAVRFKQR
jgi:alpha-glucosidase